MQERLVITIYGTAITTTHGAVVLYYRGMTLSQRIGLGQSLLNPPPQMEELV
jgi:hypothetical protein